MTTSFNYRNDNGCFIYVMRVCPYPEHEIIKVGITKNIQTRVSSLQTGCAWPIEVSECLRVPSQDAAREIEREFHEANAKSRMTGEWFFMPAHVASCEIAYSITDWWEKANGLKGLWPFLTWAGLNEDDASEVITACYGDLEGAL